MSGARLQIVGGGKMGEALLAGLIGQGWATEDQFVVVEKDVARVEDLRATFPMVVVTSGPPAPADGHVVAVKPPDVPGVCEVLSKVGDRAPVLSIAAGVTIAAMEAELAPGTPVVRAMPNTPALVGAGAAAIAGGAAATDATLDWAESILGAVGTVVRVGEPLLDAVTGLSGSGPAYLFLVLEAMIDGGVLAGLPRPVAAQLATQTLVGAGKLVAETGEPPAELRAAVTSPAGTTAAGLHALERAGVRAAVLDAVLAATERSRELGRGQVTP
jgi:pyrroline-5-carboxylate reductase